MKETIIIDEMMQKLMSNQLTPGEKLPSENELAEKYDVPRMTVRKALTKLEERGYVYTKKGKGRYVQDKSGQIQLHLTGKESFTDKMLASGYDLRTENVFCQKEPKSSRMYKRLHADVNTAVYKISRVRYIDGAPIAIHHSFLSESVFPKIGVDGPNLTSLFAYYRDKGYQDFTSTQALLSVVFPTLEEQQQLACNNMTPLIMVESDCVDQVSDKVLEYTKIVYRSDKFKYDITMK
ncbi:GntR family transcriptional regulator [Cytobacillus purgationiresistens]|nr:GntR family transcriptional regulator [Cytobacillus purgationiresistens]